MSNPVLKSGEDTRGVGIWAKLNLHVPRKAQDILDSTIDWWTRGVPSLGTRVKGLG